ncbi:MAG: 50S ribosomal protein L18 [Parcubacteria group bacterium]|nr:50S ribosomal protein L18 [Parcubacteria group bacterium]
MKKQLQRQRRKQRTRAKIYGTTERPRLSVFRSLNHIYAQIINDEKSITLVSASDLELKKEKKAAKKELAREVGKLLASKAKDKKINQVVFDKSSFRYHGRVKELAEGAREGGLKF